MQGWRKVREGHGWLLFVGEVLGNLGDWKEMLCLVVSVCLCL